MNLLVAKFTKLGLNINFLAMFANFKYSVFL